MTNLSLEEPRALVQQLVTKFMPENDALSIQNVSTSFNQLLMARQKKMAQSRETLQCKCLRLAPFDSLKLAFMLLLFLF